MREKKKSARASGGKEKDETGNIEKHWKKVK